MKAKCRVFFLGQSGVSAMRVHAAHQSLNVLGLLIVFIPLVIFRRQERRLKASEKITLRLTVMPTVAT